MMWYGFRSSISQSRLHNCLQYSRQKINLQTRCLMFQLVRPKPKLSVGFGLPVLKSWRAVILDGGPYFYIYLYSSIYFFYFIACSSRTGVKYNTTSQYLSIIDFYWTTFYLMYWLWLKNIFFSFSRLFFFKLTFRGKGYYIYKSHRNTIALRFGYSHRIYIYAFDISLVFVTKTVVLVFGLNKFDLWLFTAAFYATKPINIFTGRGIRFTRQIIYKKTGKVSTYR